MGQIEINAMVNEKDAIFSCDEDMTESMLLLCKKGYRVIHQDHFILDSTKTIMSIIIFSDNLNIIKPIYEYMSGKFNIVIDKEFNYVFNGENRVCSGIGLLVTRNYNDDDKNNVYNDVVTLINILVHSLPYIK